jgi:hypothetical protein
MDLERPLQAAFAMSAVPGLRPIPLERSFPQGRNAVLPRGASTSLKSGASTPLEPLMAATASGASL